MRAQRGRVEITCPSEPYSCPDFLIGKVWQTWLFGPRTQSL
jgi:hypothetical protein